MLKPGVDIYWCGAGPETFIIQTDQLRFCGQKCSCNTSHQNCQRPKWILMRGKLFIESNHQSLLSLLLYDGFLSFSSSSGNQVVPDLTLFRIQEQSSLGLGYVKSLSQGEVTFSSLQKKLLFKQPEAHEQRPQKQNLEYKLYIKKFFANNFKIF